MSGIEIYNDKYQNKIDSLLEKNKDLRLTGFANFIQNSSLSTVHSYVSYIIKFLRYCNKKLDGLQLDDYTEYMATLKKKAPSYQIAVYSALKWLSAYCVASGHTAIDYMEKVSRPKYKERKETKTKRETGFLTKEEIDECFENINEGVGSSYARLRQSKWKLRDTLIYKIFLVTGMRCSALYKLDVDSIDRDRSVLITVDKGGDVQEFPLDPGILRDIDEWINERNRILDGKNEQALFISNRLSRMSSDAIGDIVSKYASTIKGKNITPHKLRATFGTQLYDATKDIYMVQECMGHSNPTVTSLYIRGQKNTSRQKSMQIMSELTSKN